jgi:hypothetical protein
VTARKFEEFILQFIKATNGYGILKGTIDFHPSFMILFLVIKDQGWKNSHFLFPILECIFSKL